MSKRRTLPIDPELARIDALETAIIAAHDERAAMGADPAEVARQRPGVVELARNVCNKLREEYRGRALELAAERAMRAELLEKP